MRILRPIIVSISLCIVSVSANVESIGDEVLMYYYVYKNDFNTKADPKQRDMGSLSKCRALSRTVPCNFYEFLEDLFDGYYKVGKDKPERNYFKETQFTDADRTLTPDEKNVNANSPYQKMIQNMNKDLGAQGTGLKVAHLHKNFEGKLTPPFATVNTAVVETLRVALTTGKVPTGEARTIVQAAIRAYLARNESENVKSAIRRSINTWTGAREKDLKKYLALDSEAKYFWKDTINNVEGDSALTDAQKKEYLDKISDYVSDLRVLFPEKIDADGKTNKYFRQAANHLALMSRYVFLRDQIGPRVSAAEDKKLQTIPHDKDLDTQCKDKLGALTVPAFTGKGSKNRFQLDELALRASLAFHGSRRILAPKYRGLYRSNL